MLLKKKQTDEDELHKLREQINALEERQASLRAYLDGIDPRVLLGQEASDKQIELSINNSTLNSLYLLLADVEKRLAEAHEKRGKELHKQYEDAFVYLQRELDVAYETITSLRNRREQLEARARAELAVHPSQLKQLVTEHCEVNNAVTRLISSCIKYRKVIAETEPSILTSGEIASVYSSLRIDPKDWHNRELIRDLKNWLRSYREQERI